MIPTEKRVGYARIGFALTGSFCTFATAFACMEEIVAAGGRITPIVSFAADATDTRFGKAAKVRDTLRRITGQEPINTLAGAEPIGPQRLLDLLLILPATGNTLAKLAHGIADTPVTMAAKSHLRNERPLVLAVSSNDALGRGAQNIGALLNMKHVYFVPFGQDDPAGKARSLVFKKERVMDALADALDGRQTQPILVG